MWDKPTATSGQKHYPTSSQVRLAAVYMWLQVEGLLSMCVGKWVKPAAVSCSQQSTGVAAVTPGW